MIEYVLLAFVEFDVVVVVIPILMVIFSLVVPMLLFLCDKKKFPLIFGYFWAIFSAYTTIFCRNNQIQNKAKEMSVQSESTTTQINQR